MENANRVLQCEKISIEISTINGLSIDVIKARDLYMRLDIPCKYDVWLKDVTSVREVAKDFFYSYSDNGLDCLFTVKAAKEVAFESGASSSKALLGYFQSHEEAAKKNALDDILLSDVDKSFLVQDFASAIGWSEKSVVLPTDTLLAMVDTLRLCKMHIDQIQSRLSKCDFLDPDVINFDKI